MGARVLYGGCAVRGCFRVPLTVSLAALGCGHVLHPAAVVPGPVLDLQVGMELPEHRPRPDASALLVRAFDPYRSTELLVQGAFGYGWRYSENQALQVTVSIGNIAAPALDLYWQVLGGRLDLGIGATVGVGMLLSGYGMIGRGLSLGEQTELRIDGGYRVAPWVDSASIYGASAHGPIALISYVARPLGFGLWLDQLWFSQTIYGHYCDDTCRPEDTVSERFSLGAFLRLPL